MASAARTRSRRSTRRTASARQPRRQWSETTTLQALALFLHRIASDETLPAAFSGRNWWTIRPPSQTPYSLQDDAITRSDRLALNWSSF
jgi:hypothetical protein